MTSSTSGTGSWRPDPSGLADERWHDGVMWTAQTRTAPAATAAAVLVPAGAAATSGGWYPDPAGSRYLRYFDGATWTDHLAPVPDDTPRPSAARTQPPAKTGTATSAATTGPQRRSPARRGPRWLKLKHVGTAAMIAGITASAYMVWSLALVDVVTDYQQRSLREEMAAAAPLTVPTTAGTPSSTGPAKSLAEAVNGTSASPSQPAGTATVPTLPKDGKPVGTIRIPSIGVNEVFVAGTAVPDLKKGPGVWKHGVFPGTPGNATISGHRTTYGGPFRHIDELKTGDKIVIEVAGQPDAVYEVRGSAIVRPSQISVTEQTKGVRLTLTTCEPVGSDAKRLVIQAELVSGAWASQALPRDGWKVQK
jgi:LPXTG-site transpeptidase (sortase) family protein